MANIYAPRQFRASGKWGMTKQSDESMDAPIHRLCTHEHDTLEEARSCPQARQKMPSYLDEDHQKQALFLVRQAKDQALRARNYEMAADLRTLFEVWKDAKQ